MQPERPSLTMPAELTRRARAIVEGRDAEWQVPPAVDAATVILLRDTDAGLEVFLQRRVNRMTFAPGMYVFPGGRVEESDATVPWVGPSVEYFAVPESAGATAHFRALTAAGARETWEEAGAALAGTGQGPVRGTPARPEDDYVDWLRQHGYHVDGAAFLPWSHWITPEVEVRRFDTRFLVTALPDGQQAVDRGVESDHSSWFRPADALDRVRAGQMPMLPPTSHALGDLALFPDVAAVLDQARTRRPRPLLPRPVADGDGDVAWQLVDAYSGEVAQP